MFGRLNPTKPSAAHRAVLERVGAACREWRLSVKSGKWRVEGLKVQPRDESVAILAKHGVFRVGVAAEFGGCGTEPLLVVMAAERIGREGLALCEPFVRHAEGVAVLERWGTGDQKATHLARAVRGESVLGCVADDAGVRLTARLVGRLATAAGCVGALADSLEALASVIREALTAQPAGDDRADCERFVADTATDLEATRALVYAAAELKGEFDRHTTSKHLEWESTALVTEAHYLAALAMNRMLHGAGQLLIDGTALIERLPPWHRVALDATVLADEPADSLQSLIANYYLFQ